MEFFSAGNLLTLLMLVILQIVLGVDNLLYISLESQNVPQNKQRLVRWTGIGIAIVLRILLLFLLVSLIDNFQKPLFSIMSGNFIEGEFNVHALIVFIGGGFIMYTAVKEIWHMISLDDNEIKPDVKSKSINNAIFMIVLMNIIFSVDSTLSAIALTKNIWVMIISILIGGVMMMWLSDKVSTFLNKNKKFEVLGLFILFLIGIMLISEAGHLAHLKLFGSEIHQMSKGNFYFVIAVLIIVDLIQTRYKKKLAKVNSAEAKK